jgi:hypothetical protein
MGQYFLEALDCSISKGAGKLVTTPKEFYSRTGESFNFFRMLRSAGPSRLVHYEFVFSPPLLIIYKPGRKTEERAKEYEKMIMDLRNNKGNVIFRPVESRSISMKA